MFKPVEIANYFIKLAEEEDSNIPNIKLQKLVYIANGYYWGYYAKPLINEIPQAWDFGPVIDSLYTVFKKYGVGDVTDYGTSVFVKSSKVKITSPILNENKNPVVADFLKAIWEIYGNLTSNQLCNLTNQKDSPWEKVTKEYKTHNLKMPDSVDINSDHIKSYYEERMKREVDVK